MSVMRLNQSAPRAVIEGLVLAIALTGLSYIVGALFGWLPNGVNWWEFGAVFTSYWCTYLCVMQRRINYPLGAISSALYCVLFVQQDLVASALLNGYLVIALVYGWLRWRKDSNARPVTRVSLKATPLYILTTAVFYGGAVWLVTAFGGSFAPLDTVILIGTILAQFLMDNKKIENWVIWAIVDVVAIYVYFSSGLPIATFQYVFFLANTVWGFFEWKRSYDAKRVIQYGQIVEGPTKGVFILPDDELPPMVHDEDWNFPNVPEKNS